MLFIKNENTNPYFNLALEEYLLKEFNEDCFMLWQNEPCIVIGKNQHILNEINKKYVKETNIKVASRLSGGGTVYHDLGNLNFTFIVNDTKNNFLNYRKFTMPIIEVLSKLGIKAELSVRNDLTIEGLKFSGNAQFKHKNRLLHHGTILFSSSLNDIKTALEINKTNTNRRWVKSVPSTVTNVQEHLSEPLSLEELKILIQTHIASKEENSRMYNLTFLDIERVNKLVQEKYSTINWNYGIPVTV
jgi:lipoate-protein ligase A